MNDPKHGEETLFETLSQLPANERAAELEKACGQDAALRERLEKLLAAHDRASQFMAEPAAPNVPRAGALHIPVAERLGDQIGPYKLLQRIGEGGCGVVYMAQQEQPVRRLVALKVIKLGMDTRQVVARFEAERQALALMDHPNIARVLDAGATDTGRPFFVMELVRGIRITDYCDQNQLPTRKRLELFVEVCRAVHHAHQKGIIHRDLKPSNVLVAVNDGVPVPKVIDFGIAKATQAPLTDKTLVTAFEQFIGTPAYVSPEQALMTSLDIDTRSDIYSLGVLLYELLTGKTPFDTQQLLEAGLEKMRRTICEEQPARPSTRLDTMTEADRTTTARARQVEPSKLTSLLRGDLDWIVMKCLEKDRTRRFEAASGLARDIERHLNSEAVMARPPSRLYEFQRTVRRHWVGFAATAAVITALGIGMGVSTLEAARARRAEQEQNRQRIAAEQAQGEEARQKATAQEELYSSLLAQARATRLARQAGYREEVFALLKQAKALDVPPRNLEVLRQEAVACMGDFVGLKPSTFSDFPTNIVAACLAPSGELAAFALVDGTIQLRAMPSGKEVGRLVCTNAFVWALRFNHAGDQLLAVVAPLLMERTSGLPERRICAWARDMDGHWRETENRLVPGATVGLFEVGEELFDVLLKFDGPLLSGTNLVLAKFRLYNLTTHAVVPGWGVTNAYRPLDAMQFCVSGNGRWLAVDTGPPGRPEPHVISLYDWKTGSMSNRLERLGSGMISLSDDGKYLAYLFEDGNIYTVPELESIGYFPAAGIAPAAFSGNMAAVPIQADNRIRLWNLTSKEDVGLLDQPQGRSLLIFASQGDALLAVGLRKAQFQPLSTPEKLNLPARTAVRAIDFSPDGSYLASVCDGPIARVCDARTGRALWETNLPGNGHAVAYSPDGQWLAIGYWDKELVSILEAGTGQRLVDIGTNGPGRTWGLQFSPDGRYFAAPTEPMGLRIWALDTGSASAIKRGLEAKPLKSWRGDGETRWSKIGLSFGPDSRSVAFWSGGLWLWDFERSAEPRDLAPRVFFGESRASFTPDGHSLIAMNSNGMIVAVDVASGKQVPIHDKQDHEFDANGLCLSPDGSKVAVNSASRFAVNIREARHGKLLYALPAEPGWRLGFVWSPDGRRLAISRNNGNVAIWNFETVDQILTQLGLSPEQ